MNEKPIFIQGPCGQLEALLQVPDQSFNQVAAICHPHPLYGGSMNNKVVHTLGKTLQEQGLATLRFNFRGVGKSAGAFASGEGEAEDLMAVLDWMQKEYPQCSLCLAGFSFGAYVALKVASHYPLKRLILIAPPVGHFPIKDLPLPECPMIVVQGDSDEIVSPQAVFDWVYSLPTPPTLIVMENTTHFFHGHLGKLKMLLETALKG